MITDFPPPPDEFDNDEEDPPLSINDDYDENDIDSSLPPPSEEDFDGPNPEESIDEGILLFYCSSTFCISLS